MAKVIQFLARRPPMLSIIREPSPEFGGQVESICRHDLWKHLVQPSGTERLFQPPRSLRKHAVGKNVDHHLPQFLIFRGGGQQLLSRALIQSYSVQLVAGHPPPARQDSAGQKTGYKVFPDQRLHAFWNDEILLHPRQSVGKVGKRTSEMSTAARNQPRSLPGLLTFGA